MSESCPGASACAGIQVKSRPRSVEPQEATGNETGAEIPPWVASQRDRVSVPTPSDIRVEVRPSGAALPSANEVREAVELRPDWSADRESRSGAEKHC